MSTDYHKAAMVTSLSDLGRRERQIMDIVVRRGRAQKTRSAQVPILLIDALDLDPKNNVGAEVAPIDVTFLPAHTVILGTATSNDQLRVIIGADGRCRGAASGSTAKDKFSMRPTSKALSPSKGG